MSGRKPRQDELDLWRKVAKQVSPIRRTLAETMPARTEVKSGAPGKSEAPALQLPPRLSGAKPAVKNDLAPSLEARLSRDRVQMDKRAFERMKRGKLRPDGKLDLHGMTLDRAHGALNRFVLSSHANGKRLLLVITGKGKSRDEGGPIPVRLGVLRHQVPEWLRMPPLSSVVLQVSQAHQSHGGAGAYYVYLRKPR